MSNEKNLSSKRTHLSASVDVHVHLVHIDETRLQAIDGVKLLEGKGVELDGHAITSLDLFQPKKLLEWMDQQLVELALISIPPPLYRQHLNEEQAREWLGYLNDGLEVIAQQYPDRLQVLAYLPMEHPQLALAETGKRLGKHYAGFSLAAGGSRTINYADTAFRPLWQFLHDSKSFVFLHPGNSCDERLHRFYADNLLGNPYETAVAVSHLLFGGIVEDFPDINFCLAHCGGVVAAVAGRWQQGFDTNRPGIDSTREPPVSGLKRFYVDCISHDNGLINLAQQVFGEDKILFGSDWPFPMGIMNPDEYLNHLDKETKERILYKNYQGLVNRKITLKFNE